MSTTIHPDFDHEQAFLRHAHHCLEEMGKNVEKLGDATGDPKAASALASMKKRMLERLQDPESVCFGRLDFDQGDADLRGAPDGGGREGQSHRHQLGSPCSYPFL